MLVLQKGHELIQAYYCREKNRWDLVSLTFIQNNFFTFIWGKKKEQLKESLYNPLDINLRASLSKIFTVWLALGKGKALGNS